MLERNPAVMKNATNKPSTTPRASRFCAWLGARLEMTKSCSSGAGGAVVIIEPHLGVIGVCLSALPADQSNHQDPPESAFDEPEAVNPQPDCFRTLIFWQESIRRASAKSMAAICEG